MKLHTVGNASYPPMEYLPASDEADYKPGQALIITDGVATLASGTTKPEYICMGMTDNGLVPAIRITPDQTFETKLAVAPGEEETLNVGDTVTINTDGITVTATTTNGVAKIVAIEGTAVGDKVLVKF